MKLKCCSIAFLVFAVSCSALFAGTTGKIMGRVIDAGSNEPLIGANVLVEGTSMGAATDLDGKFIILNVPPGGYTLRVTMMGFKSVRMQNVVVSVDLTTEANFNLQPTVLESGEAVTVVAERPMVVKDLTASTAVVGADEMAALPVTEVTEAIELQAGLVRDAGGGLHVRGGRSGEISYWIDGIPVTDVYDGGTVVEVNKEMVQELQVVSGAFNAEYGQAMSGIVNITTKEGTNDFGGSLTGYLGDYVSGHNDIFMNIDNFNPTSIYNFEASLHGALLKDKLFFYSNARSYYSDGWLYGQRIYNPSAVTLEFNNLTTDIIQEYMPEYLKNSYLADPVNDLRNLRYVLGSNARIDSILARSYMPVADADSFGVYYQKLREAHQDGKGDGAYRPMNWNRKIYAQGKLIYRLTPSLKLSYNYIFDGVDYSDYWHDYKLNPDGNLKKFREGQTHIFQWTHAVNTKTFYKLGVSYFSKDYKEYVYEDPYDSRYVHPDLAVQEAFSFKTGGTANTRKHRRTETVLTKFDIESQISSTHLLKTGFEYRKHDVSLEDIELQAIESQTNIDEIFESPYIQTRVMADSTLHTDYYLHRPIELSAYLQDKMEFKNMIVNLGIRFDYFDPDGVTLTDESDPSIYNPIKVANRYYDYGSDGIPNTYDADGTEGNGLHDEGEAYISLSDRESYWYQNASSKWSLSPRLGVSFPITERGVIHFSYGHFFQIPRFERLYQNPDFELGSGTGNVGVIGNADLSPEQTVSGEIGVQQQVSNDVSVSVTGYFRDVRDLAGTNSEEILLYGESARYSKIVNGDFGFIRGIIIAINKRFADGWGASFDYTLQVAKGSNSDPEQARNAISGGSQPEIQLTSLDWDQKHTVNSSLSYGGTNWGTSVIVQWGSGLPYTPRRSEDISSLLTNSQLKPSAYNVDLRMYRDFDVGPGKLSLFFRVLNLFDTLNEVNVYNDTGRAGFTSDEQTALNSNPTQSINTVAEYYTNPTFYAEPRRIEAGFSYTF